MVNYVGAHDLCEAWCPKAEHSQGQPLSLQCQGK